MCKCWVWSELTYSFPHLQKELFSEENRLISQEKQSLRCLYLYVLAYLLLTDLHVDYFVCDSKSIIIQSLPFDH